MIFILFLYIFLTSITDALNCSVSQIHIAQGFNSSSMTISWLTPDKCLSYVEYGLNYKSLNNNVIGSSSSYEYYYNGLYYKSGYLHHTLLTELKPNTFYFYKCGGSLIKSFKTLPIKGDNKMITFAVIGDIGQTSNSFSTIRNILNEPDINMILHAGDLSYADCNQFLWDSYGEMIEPLASNKPWMVCPGNHEIEFNGTDYSNFFTAFETRYKMPSIKPAEYGDIIIKPAINLKTGQPYCTPSIFQMEYNFGNSFFSFDSGLAHIIYLNPYTNSAPNSQQYIWLKNDLNNVDRTISPWLIIVMHCPWYSSNTNHYGDTQTVLMRESMEDLFYKYGVNIVFNGHVHDYERSYPVYKNITNRHGTVYVTIGNAGNLEGLDSHYYEQPSWSAFRNGNEYGYGLLTIFNEKKMYWRWFVNNGKQIISRDKLLLCNTLYGSSDCY